MSSELDELQKFISDYESYLKQSFEALWSEVPIDPIQLEAFSVIGALLSRQVTLSMQLARSPATWNGHSAPLFLRAQTDLHITIAWILADLIERSKKYVLYGLGQEKLIIEQYKNELDENPDDPDNALIEELIEVKSAWINGQRNEWMVEVNLGRWAHLDTRKMAIEADCESLYKFSYQPFSQAAHSMWPHVSVYNSRHCENPLHRHHLIPDLLEINADVDYLYRSCKYVHKTYDELLLRFSINKSFLMPLDWWTQYFSDEEQIEA